MCHIITYLCHIIILTVETIRQALANDGWAGDEMVAVRVDAPLITAQGEGTALDFALILIEILQDASSASAVAMLARHPHLDRVTTLAPDAWVLLCVYICFMCTCLYVCVYVLCMYVCTHTHTLVM